MSLVRIASLDDVWRGEVVGLRVEDSRVLLVHLEDGVHAYEDRCAHLGMPLSHGRLDGDVLTCPFHGVRYDLRTGACVDEKGGALTTIPVRIVGDAVFLDLGCGHAKAHAR